MRNYPTYNPMQCIPYLLARRQDYWPSIRAHCTVQLP